MRNLSLGAIRKHKTIHWGKMGCPPQRWMSHSYSREHTYRRVSVTLQRRRSLLLQTPRWSGGQDFILQLRREMPGSIYIPIRFPPSAQLFESWLYFLEEFRRYCSLPREELLQVVAERKGFRWKIIDILRTLSEQKVSVLFFDQLERWPLSIVEDLQLAWIQVQKEKGDAHTTPLVLAGALQGGLFPNRIWLNDYSQYESISILKSVLSRDLSTEEEQLVQLSGGIPELLHALIWGIKNGAATQSWSSVHREIRSVIDLIGARSFLLERLYELQSGSSDFQSKSDHILKQAGLVRTDLINGVRVSSLRAPYVSEVLRLDSV